MCERDSRTDLKGNSPTQISPFPFPGSLFSPVDRSSSCLAFAKHLRRLPRAKFPSAWLNTNYYIAHVQIQPFCIVVAVLYSTRRPRSLFNFLTIDELTNLRALLPEDSSLVAASLGWFPAFVVAICLAFFAIRQTDRPAPRRQCLVSS